MEEKPDGTVYALPGCSRRYIKLKSYIKDNSTFGVIIDVTEDFNERQQIAYERDVDLLTGLTSRRAFFTRMDQLFETPQNIKNMALLMTDVDNLKYVNDGYGHLYGDQLLQAAAGLLQLCEAPHQITARLSGDEFVLVVYGCESPEEAVEYINQVQKLVGQEELALPGGERFPVWMSGGYVLYPEYTVDCHELLHLADQTMYQVKKNGKHRFARCQFPCPPTE